jgi:repressor LexA
MKDLTPIQNEVLDFVTRQIERQQPFPSLREIASHFGFTHTTARFHLKALEKKGYIRQREQRVSEYVLTRNKRASSGMFALVASIPAGTPSSVYDETAEMFSVDQDFFGGGNIKALTVKGDSMSGDAITDGDIAMIRLQNEAVLGDILAIRVEGEITLKRIRQNENRIELLPSNREFPVRSVPAEQVEILGKLVGVVRKL